MWCADRPEPVVGQGEPGIRDRGREVAGRVGVDPVSRRDFRSRGGWRPGRGRRTGGGGRSAAQRHRQRDGHRHGDRRGHGDGHAPRPQARPRSHDPGRLAGLMEHRLPRARRAHQPAEHPAGLLRGQPSTRIGSQQTLDHGGQRARPGGCPRRARRLPGQGGVKRRAQRPHVAGPAGGLAAQLFRRHVPRRADYLTCAGQLLLALDDRDPEVGDNRTAGREQDVGRLDVPVEYPRVVRGPQRRQHLHADSRDQVRGQGTVRADGVVQRQRADEFHDDPRAAVGEHQIVDRHDPGMVQSCRGPRLTERPPVPLAALVGDENLLDRDVTVKDEVVSLPDIAHAALPKEPDELIAISDQAPA